MRVGISHDFFAKSLNDYSDWKWAWVREISQNSIDCGADCISIIIEMTDGQTKVIAENNGPPMTRDILLNKFLCLGGTTKEFKGTVGGFGVAKTVLCLAHPRYMIETGSHIVQGSGGEFELEEGEYFSGTRTTVWMKGDHADELIQKFKSFAAMCQWSGSMYLNNQPVATNLRKGSRRRDLGWATIYTNKSFPHRLIVRVDGMPMFQRYISLERCVIVEVNRSSGDAFQSSRDGLVFDYRRKLEAFIDELTVDRSKALRDTPVTEWFHFEGARQEYGGIDAEPVGAIVQAAYATLPQIRTNPAENTPFVEAEAAATYDDLPPDSGAFRTEMESRCTHEFVVKNNTGLVVPGHFMPHSFSAYSRKLVSVWVKCLLAIHKMYNHADTFAVGFIIDDDPEGAREAEFEKTEDYGKVYYINPAVVVTQESSVSRSLKKRWKFVTEGYYAILVAAAHEFVHCLGYGPHDEGYACKLGDVLAAVLAKKKDFHPCFR